MSPTDELTTPQALARVLAEVSALRSEVAELRRAERARAELWDEVMPIARLALDSAARRLQELEERGVLAFGRELAGVGAKVVEHFGPGDVRAFGDAVVTILQTVRTWTQPGVLSLAQEAGEAVEGLDPDDKLGMIGVLAASRDRDVQHGAALAVGVLRRLGRAASASSARPTPGRPAGWQRLQARLGPSGAAVPGRPAPAPSRPLPARAVAAPAGARPAAPAAHAAPAGAGVAVPGALPPPAGFEALGWDAQGHLREADRWTEALAAAAAAQHGLALDAARMAVVAAARAHHASAGAAPNVRRLTQVAAITTRELYELFPERPGSTVARIAGLPKPGGCI